MKIKPWFKPSCWNLWAGIAERVTKLAVFNPRYNSIVLIESCFNPIFTIKSFFIFSLVPLQTNHKLKLF